MNSTSEGPIAAIACAHVRAAWSGRAMFVEMFRPRPSSVVACSWYRLSPSARRGPASTMPSRSRTCESAPAIGPWPSGHSEITCTPMRCAEISARNVPPGDWPRSRAQTSLPKLGYFSDRRA